MESGHEFLIQHQQISYKKTRLPCGVAQECLVAFVDHYFQSNDRELMGHVIFVKLTIEKR